MPDPLSSKLNLSLHTVLFSLITLPLLFVERLTFLCFVLWLLGWEMWPSWDSQKLPSDLSVRYGDALCMVSFRYLPCGEKSVCNRRESEREAERQGGKDMEMEIEVKLEPHLRLWISVRPLLDQWGTPLNFLVLCMIKFHCLPQIFWGSFSLATESPITNTGVQI